MNVLFFNLQVEDDLHSFCYHLRKKKHIFKQVACGRHDMDFFKTLFCSSFDFCICTGFECVTDPDNFYLKGSCVCEWQCV